MQTAEKAISPTPMTKNAFIMLNPVLREIQPDGSEIIESTYKGYKVITRLPPLNLRILAMREIQQMLINSEKNISFPPVEKPADKTCFTCKVKRVLPRAFQNRRR